MAPSCHVGYGEVIPFTCHGCVAYATLFVGQGQTLSAYALGSLTLPEPQTSPAWTINVPGKLVDSLLVLGNRLFATVLMADGLLGIGVLDRIFDPRPTPFQWLGTASRISPLAGDQVAQKVFYLVESQGSIEIHTIDASRRKLPLAMHPITDVPSAPLVLEGLLGSDVS